MNNNAISWYLSELNALLNNAESKKTQRFVYGLLSLVGLVVFYFRDGPIEFDIINAISAFVVLSYIFCNVSLIITKTKVKRLSDEFVSSGKFDEADLEARQEYNAIIAEINELKL